MPKSSKQLDAEIAGALATAPRKRSGHEVIPLMRAALKKFAKKLAGKATDKEHQGLLGGLVASDFEKHDVPAVKRRPSEPFVWFLGNSGTHQVWLDLDERCPEALLDGVADTWSPNQREIYFWDGRALRPFQSVSELCERLHIERDRRSER